MVTVEEIQYSEGKMKEIVAHLVGLYEARWLWLFTPGVREHDEELEVFSLDLEDWQWKESFNHSTPKVIPLYENVYSRQGEGLGFDYFIKGAVAFANLYHEPDLLTDFFQSQLELMMEAQEYPRIDENYVSDYADIVEAILLGEEQTTWKQMLAYTAGVYWMLGMVHPDSMYPEFTKDLRQHMLNKAKLGTVDGI